MLCFLLYESKNRKKYDLSIKIYISLKEVVFHFKLLISCNLFSLKKYLIL